MLKYSRHKIHEFFSVANSMCATSTAPRIGEGGDKIRCENC